MLLNPHLRADVAQIEIETNLRNLAADIQNLAELREKAGESNAAAECEIAQYELQAVMQRLGMSQ